MTLYRYTISSQRFTASNNNEKKKIPIKRIKPGLYAFYRNKNNIKNTLKYTIKTMSMNYLSTKIPITK